MTGAVGAGRPWVRVGAYALVLDGTARLLLVRGRPSSDGFQRWWLPGGGLDFGEDPEAAVLRELREETGLDGRVDGVVGTFSTVYPTGLDGSDDPVQVVGIVYRVSVAGDAIQAEVDGSTDLCAWVGADEAEALPLSPGASLGVRLAWPGRG